MRTFTLFLVIFTLAGCTTTHQNRDFQRSAYPNLYNALDKEKDGFSSTSPSGESFSIVSTYANAAKLCRLVEFESSEAFYAETFCKAKGGEWR